MTRKSMLSMPDAEQILLDGGSLRHEFNRYTIREKITAGSRHLGDVTPEVRDSLIQLVPLKSNSGVWVVGDE